MKNKSGRTIGRRSEIRKENKPNHNGVVTEQARISMVEEREENWSEK